jgi:hypothetical protein
VASSLVELRDAPWLIVGVLDPIPDCRHREDHPGVFRLDAIELHAVGLKTRGDRCEHGVRCSEVAEQELAGRSVARAAFAPDLANAVDVLLHTGTAARSGAAGAAVERHARSEARKARVHLGGHGTSDAACFAVGWP